LFGSKQREDEVYGCVWSPKCRTKSLLTANTSFGNVAKSKYLGTTV